MNIHGEWTDEDRKAAAADLNRYCKLMIAPDGWRGCLRIEEKWGLDGLPPQAVTQELVEIAGDFGKPEAAQ